MWFTGRIRVVAVLAQAHDRTTLNEIASRGNWNLQLPRNCASALQALKQHPAAVVLCDKNVPRCDWRAAMDSLRQSAPASRMILTTPATDDKLWLEVLERGGFDVVTTPFHERRLVDTIGRAWAEIMK